ncbi:hypothetical protein D9M72_374340 [compost metagenome]
MIKKSAVIIGIGAEIQAQPYLNKLSRVLLEKGFAVEYVCWSRGGSAVLADGLTARVLYKSQPLSKAGFIFSYIIWMLRLFFYFAFAAKKDAIYFASRIDAAAPLSFVSMFKSLGYVYLDRDAAHMSYRLGRMRGVVRKIEELVGKRALIHLVPGEGRDFTKSSNVRVVENAPLSSEIIAAKKLFEKRGEKIDARTTIYINGWLAPTRGVEFMSEAVKMLSVEKFRILVAGRPACADAESLISLPNVEYLGILSNAEALSYYLESDVVLSFYDPRIEVNRQAEPNKWFDCAVFGVRFVSNFEIETAARFIDLNYCRLVEYGDVQGLLRVLEGYDRKRADLDWKIEGMKIIPWDMRVGQVIDECVGNPLLTLSSN